MHEPDAQRLRHRRRPDHDRRAVEEDRAAVRCQYAVYHVHQRRLAGAVLSGKGMNLAPLQFEIDAAQGADRPEGLDQFADPEDWGGFRTFGHIQYLARPVATSRSAPESADRRDCRTVTDQLGSRPSM